MKKILLLSLVILSAACSEDNFKKVYKLDRLRVLAITAGKQGALTQAEFDPGDTVTLEAFVSDVEGGQTVTGVIETCSDPGISFGREATCVGMPDRNTTIGNITLNTSGVAGRTGAMPTFDVTIPATVLIGRSDADQFNGVNYLVTVVFSTPDGQTIKAFKRLPVTVRAAKNTNPSLGNILHGGSNYTSYPGEGSFSLASASAEESYEFKSADGTINNLTEEMNVAWFVSDGELNFPVTGKAGTTTFKPGTKGELVTVAVIRDGRGGMAVTIKKVP